MVNSSFDVFLSMLTIETTTIEPSAYRLYRRASTMRAQMGRDMGVGAWENCQKTQEEMQGQIPGLREQQTFRRNWPKGQYFDIKDNIANIINRRTFKHVPPLPSFILVKRLPLSVELSASPFGRRLASMARADTRRRLEGNGIDRQIRGPADSDPLAGANRKRL
jgi:hypothetical protein